MTKRNVTQLMISEELFRLVIGSVARVSIFNRRFESVNGLVQTFLEQNDPLKPSIVEELKAMSSLTGDIKLFLRLTDVGDRPNRMRAALSEAVGRHCTMRELVAYVCLAWSELPPLTIGPR